MKTNIKFIKTSDAVIAARLISDGAMCYGQNAYGEWYFKNVPTLKFSNEEKPKVFFTSIMNM